MSDLVVASTPTNLRRKPDGMQRTVTSDLYSICDRLKELDPNLYIVEQDGWEEDTPPEYIIMEYVPSKNVSEIVMKTKSLDQRILKKFDEMRALPYKDRIEKVMRDVDSRNEAAKENDKEELWERMGAPMYKQLHRDGFSHGGRSKSYPIVRPKKWRQ